MIKTILNKNKKRLLLSTFLVIKWGINMAQLAANFTATTVNGCAPLTVNFQDLSKGNPTAWQWNLGNGTISNAQSPSTSYFNPGTYTISLKISNTSGNDSITKVQFITVYTNPIVNFSATATTGCFPLRTNFSDLSISGSGSITGWYWDLGDGDTSSLKNPSHIYTAVGNYPVTLKATNSNGCSKVLTKPQYIQVTNGVTVGFTNSPVTNCKPPQTINFENTSTGPASLTYEWDFGDSSTSTALNPSHIYTTSGVYSAKLTTTSSAGCFDTLVKYDSIVIRNYQTNFSGPDSICVGVTANFMNTSVPAPVSVFWNFGDDSTSTLTNATKAWSTPATYLLKLIDNYGVCIDSVVKNINVISKLVTNFTCTDSFNCKAPFTTQFEDLTAGSISWAWNFGDGSTSTVQNPTHTYIASGRYTVTLTVTNTLGCTTTVIKNQYINIVSPTAIIDSLPAGGCVPFQFNGVSTINDPKGISTYLWDFGDGVTSTLQLPIHIYAEIGTFTIKLYFTTNDGCSDSIIKPSSIKIGMPSTVNFTSSVISSCVGQNVQFTNLSEPSDAWVWNFGDGRGSMAQNPEHAYQVNGTYSVTLSVSNNGCIARVTKNNFIIALPPVAKFTPVYDCINKTEVTFVDNSVLPQSWSWSFGDGNISNLQSPVHNYTALGSYTVALAVKNAGCVDNDTIIIKLVNEHADFTTPKDSVCRNTPIMFTAINSIAANISNYVFDFGDGIISSSNTSTITHSYINPGVYSVKLTITDINGCMDSLTKTNYIVATGPVANFSASPLNGCIGLNVTFLDNSTTDGTHPIINWEWNYGDDSIQSLTGPPFDHTFNNGGNFYVQLKVTDSNGCFDTLTSHTPIIIDSPVANFNSPDTFACIGKNVVFNNISSGNNLSYAWTLGNGSASTQAAPITSYDSIGNYSVKLIVTDINGCQDSLKKNNYISVQIPRAAFLINDSVSYCSPFEVTFTNTSINSASQIWDFGDGSSSNLKNPVHYYSVPGTYIATLYATRTGGCIDSFKKAIVLHPSTFTLSYNPLSGCSELQVSFHVANSGSSSYFWDFGDGNTLSNIDSIATNVYQSPGNFVPKVIVTDSAGCETSLVGTNIIHLTKSFVNFQAVDSTICLGTPITFENNTTNNVPIATYHWDFGDGNTSSQKQPIHLYLTTGNYTVSLIVITTDGCSDTLIKNNYINIYGPIAKFGASILKGCKALNVIFTDSSVTDGIHPITNRYWNFGDGISGNFSATADSHSYNTAGNFIPELKITDGFGCSDSVFLSTPIDVISPVADFTSDDTLSCIGSNVFFNVISPEANLTYNWTLGNGVSSTQQNPVTTYRSDTSFTIKLVETDSLGCTDTLVKNNYIDVNLLPKGAIEGDTAGCALSSIIFNGVLLQPYKTPIAWQWHFGNGNLSFLQNPDSQKYNVAGVFPVELIVAGANGCADTIMHDVTIQPSPTIFAGGAINSIAGEAVQLTPQYSSDVISWAWAPETGLSCFDCPTPFASPSQTTHYTVIVTNQYGCTTEDSIAILLPCAGSIFIPNTFSPNNDGVNDIFYPRGKDIYVIKSLTIFDRWGETVFQRSNFAPNVSSLGWDGKFKGQPVSSDVYTYIIEVICDNNNTSIFKGDITLLR